MLCLFNGQQRQVTQIFFLEMAEEILSRSIVPAIAPPRHGGRDVISGSILRPLVAVEDQSISDVEIIGFAFNSNFFYPHTILQGLSTSGNGKRGSERIH